MAETTQSFPQLDEHVQALMDAGFTEAAVQAAKKVALAGKLARAYEHYRFVSFEKISAFNERLYQQTLKRTGQAGSDLRHRYDTLRLRSVGEYPAIPPKDVLDKVKTAAKQGIFDSFEVADIESVVEYKDPIVFGLIEGCTDRFFIAQWGDDVQISDLIGANEG